MPARFARRPLGAAPPRAAAVLASLLVAACAQIAGIPPDTSEASRVFEDVSPETAFERTVAALEELGLRVSADPAGGEITATGRGVEDRGWAECPQLPTLVRQQAGGQDELTALVDVPPAVTEVELTASVGAAPRATGGARVHLDPAFTAKPSPGPADIGMEPSTEACNTTGVLEALVFRAVETGGPPVAAR